MHWIKLVGAGLVLLGFSFNPSWLQQPLKIK